MLNKIKNLFSQNIDETQKRETEVADNNSQYRVIDTSNLKNLSKDEEVFDSKATEWKILASEWKNSNKTFSNTMQQMVADFHEAFNHPVSTKPTLIDLNRLVDRKGWGTLEEMVEQIHSVSNNEDEFLESIETIKNYLDKAVNKQLKKDFIQDEQDKIVALADGLADELYFLLGDACEVGVDIEKILTIVQDSNMSKLYTDENTGEKYAKYDENDKIKKSPDFIPPEPRIELEIKNQINK